MTALTADDMDVARELSARVELRLAGPAPHEDALAVRRHALLLALSDLLMDVTDARVWSGIDMPRTAIKVRP